MSHEQFESVTDPITDIPAWYQDNANQDLTGYEIGDLCDVFVQSVLFDGGNVTLNHGHDYLLQPEWSNLAGGCSWRLR
jgi:hypothetical protein